MSCALRMLACCLLAGGAWATALGGEAASARRISIGGEGIVRLTAEDLAAWGLGGSGRLHAYTDGQAVAVEHTRGGVELYAAPFESVYARERAFLISNQPLAVSPLPRHLRGPHERVGPRRPSPAAPGYTEVCHVEEDQYYMSGLAGATPGEEHWFYSTLLTPGRKLQLTAVLDGPMAKGTARLVVAVRGATDMAGSGPDHSLAVSLNGVRVGEVVWDGLVRKEVGFDLPAGLAVEGANTVELAEQALPGIKTDVVCVDWIEIHYPRALLARGDRLNFSLETGGVQKVTVGGFSGEDVTGFDVTRPEAPQRLALRVTRSGSNWAAEWHESQRGTRRFALAGPAGRLTPSASRAADPWTCRQAITCDYLVVTHQNYLDQAKRLADLHAAKGLRTKVYAAEQVYDAFGCGQPLPEAIRGLTQFVRPKYLCLVGDATGDPKGLLAPVTVGLLPSYLAQGTFFEEPSDNLFGCLATAGDCPDVAVGRLPARSAAEAQAMVDKVAGRLADAGPGEPSVHAALVVGDNALQIFTDGANEIAGIFATMGSVEKVMFGSYGNVAAIRAAIIAGWARQPRYFVYYGHASGSALGTGLVIRASDVPNLNAGAQPPAGVILGCLAGYFNYTSGADSLAELMLKQPGKGVCALVAPAGMSAPEGQLILGREIAKALAEGRAQSLGQALVLAKRRLPAGHADVLRSFNLLGDPAAP